MKWIVQSGFQVVSVTDSQNDFVISFNETERLPQLQVIHQKPDDAFLLIVGQVRIPKDDRDKLRKYDSKKFDDFIWNTKLNLLSLEVDFTVLGSENDPDAWETQKRLFINDANTSSFHDACSKVKRSLISIIWSYKRELASII
jgi:hypothetical protein